MGKGLFGLIRWGKDVRDDEKEERPYPTMNDMRSESASMKNSQRPNGIVKDKQ